jgi:hypothetical protein
MFVVSAVMLGLVLAANGLAMLYDPGGWYGLVPGVPDTGPLNAHFVRDIGCAYMVAGGALVWLAGDARARPAALAAAVFLTLHALVHVADAIGGRAHGGHLPFDLVAVFVPPALALWLTLRSPPMSGRSVMLKWLIRRQIAAFERSYGYDSSYARHILEVDTGAFLKFVKVMGIVRYRKSVPAAVWYAAKLAATFAEDCGPCAQLVVTMAERDGVAPAVLEAMVVGDEHAMPEDAVLGMRFAKAVMSRDPVADDLRAEIVKRWGERGLVSLAFAVTAARIFPTIKYALGHGQACRRVTVGGTAVSVLKHAA